MGCASIHLFSKDRGVTNVRSVESMGRDRGLHKITSLETHPYSDQIFVSPSIFVTPGVGCHSAQYRHIPQERER